MIFKYLRNVNQSLQKIVRKYLNRCALHGLIYLWDLKSTTKSLTEETKKDKIIEKEVKNFFTLGKRFFQTNFQGDDALQLEVERHRQLLHESRLSQGD